MRSTTRSAKSSLEEQIYRIDHYLGKEPVQNLLALRFGNALFEPLWRREWVESIQITIAEELGVEARGDFYDNTGALRDMVQNHLLQLLSIVTMEPPHSMDSDSVRDEKLRVLRALKPVDRARHRQGRGARPVSRGRDSSGTSVPALRHRSTACGPTARTETFVALKVEIENWRWAGVPFFLRTGKRLADRVAEIVVNFRPVPHSALGANALRAGANRLVIRLQPNETIRLYCLAKQPGEGMNLASVHLDLAFDQFFKRRADGGVSAPAARRDPRPPRAVRAARRTGSGVALGRTDPERMGGLDTSRRSLTRRARGDRRHRARCWRSTAPAGSKKRIEAVATVAGTQ